MYKALILDIDGTLADTLPICIESYRETLQRFAERPFQTEEITRYFGMSEEGILGVYIPEAQRRAAEDSYFEVYEAMHAAVREPFPHLREALQKLHARGVPLAVVTGKGARGAEVTLRVLGLAPLLSVVEAGFAGGPNKPESLRRVLRRFTLQPDEAVYVGDSAYDIEAAHSAGVPVVGAAWAASTTIDGAASNALRVFYSTHDFSVWLEQAF